MCSNADHLQIRCWGPVFYCGQRQEWYPFFKCLHHFGGPPFRMMSIFKYENMSRINVCVSIVL